VRENALMRWLLPLSIVLAACGAKTGLRIDHIDASVDAPVDAGVDSPDSPDSPDAPLSCVPGHFTLVRGSVEVMFVLDRSGSMALNLDGSANPPRRWTVLHDALAATLPPYQDTLQMGAYAFPRRFDASFARSCDVTRAIDVTPALHDANAVLDILATTDPWGATPTANAIDFVGSTMLPRLSADHSATIVLSTDGGPNCNVMLDVGTCTCTSVDPMGQPTCFGMPTNCLDDARTTQNVAMLAAQGIPTFVIGLDADAEPAERMALDEMARAGGRPNTQPGQFAYCSARQPDQVRAAFDTIERSITRCTLRSPSRPDDPNAIMVSIDGTTLPRDTTHANGWDWTDTSFGRISFFGAACDTVAASPNDPEVTVACTDR
jgi:hypothetical protein